MSSAFCNPERRLKDNQPVWISEQDEQGRRADPRFLKAAYALSERLLSYRQHELRDYGRAAELLERAVHAASHADHCQPVENFAGYLVRRFTGMMDAVLKREKRTQYVEPQALAEQYWTLDDDLERIENRIRLDQIMSFMDPEIRRVCIRLLDGYSMADIARELGVTSNALYLRFRRGCKKAIERLESGDPPQG